MGIDAGEKNTDKDNDILDEAKEAFEIDREYWESEYRRAEDDINFSLGDQWPYIIKNNRMSEGRPCLTENRIDVSCIQVINDIRQTRPSINVNPQDDKADIETARVLKGICRSIEQQSNANVAYDTAAENSVRGGYGFIRIGTKYESNTSFDQEIYIEAIENPFSVVIDSASRKLDGSDMRRATIFDDIPRDEFKRLYPNADPVSVEPDLQTREWCTQNTVRIAEYFYKDYEKFTLVRTPLGDMDKKDAEAQGLPWDKERESTRDIIKWCKFTGTEVLEKTTWPGKYIPIVPVYGKVVWNEGRRKSFSLTYQGRDPQMRYNFHLSAETEYTALQPKSPWMAYEDQLSDQQLKKFSSSNVKNHPVLTAKMVYDKNGNLLPLPQRQQPPSGSSAMMQQSMIAADGIKATLGLFGDSLGERENAVSGKAIIARKREGDNATFHFVDNLATSIRQVGIILVDLIPLIYSGRTIARILGEDGTPGMVPLNVPVKKTSDGYEANTQGQYVIAPDAGKYDVSVEIGPSYATKREEAFAAMNELMKSIPELMKYGADLYFKTADFPMAQEWAERAKRAMDPNIVGDEGDPAQAQLQQAGQQIQAMGQQLIQLEGKLKEKQDNQAFQNQLDAQKAMWEHENDQAKLMIDQQKLELEKERLALDALTQQQVISPEQLEAFLGVVEKQGTDLQDVINAVHIILDHHEQGELNEEPTPPSVETQPQGMLE